MSASRFESPAGVPVRTFDRPVLRRDAWASNEPPFGVHVTVAPRPFGGGVRLWICPGCGTRRRFLYASRYGWRCSACAALRYESSRVGPGCDRDITVAVNRRDEHARLHPDELRITPGPAPTPWARRKGRWWSRWSRIARRNHRLDFAVMQSISASISELELRAARLTSEGATLRPSVAARRDETCRKAASPK